MTKHKSPPHKKYTHKNKKYTPPHKKHTPLHKHKSRSRGRSRSRMNVRIINANKLPYGIYNNYVRIIVEMKKNENIPIIQFWSQKILDSLRTDGNLYFIVENNRDDKTTLLGVTFFKNMSRDFCNNMFGKKLSSSFISKAALNSYYFYYSILRQDREAELVTRSLIDKIFNIFISVNNLSRSNIVIILLQYLQLQLHTLDMISKFKPICDFIFNGSQKYKKLGFEYNGYHITLNNEIINVFMRRMLKPSAYDHTNYYPTYIISRQLDNWNANKISNLKDFLHKENLYGLNNVYRYCLNNTFVFINNFIDNGIYSITKSAPYEFNFIMNYLTNELGNQHILCNYVFLYYGLVNYYGKDAKELETFARVIENLDEVYNLLDGKYYITLRNVDIGSDNINSVDGFKTKDRFQEFCNDYTNKLLFDYVAIDTTYILDQVPNKDDLSYMISKTLLFTYINNELKLYVGSGGGIILRGYKRLDFFDKRYLTLQETSYKVMLYPNDLKNITSLSDKDINMLEESVIENAKIIAKMYKKNVTNDINQINGFRCVHFYMRPIKVGTKYKMIIINTAYFTKLSSRFNYENTDWINEVAIKPALYKNYKTPRLEPHYQPIPF